MISELDVRLALSDETHIDFLGTFSDENEHIVHVFGPRDLYVAYSAGSGWEVGTSAEPPIQS